MPLKKSELYSSIWASCDELRGGMDASQYKDYVLVLLFVKYVSDKYAGKKNALIVVPKGGGFADMVALKGNKDIGNKMNIIISALAGANDLKGVIDVADFNDSDKLGKGKEMQDRLANLVAIFENPALDFTKNRAEGDDLLGDAYEYLMRHFATESGKSKGQFYTPAEVSRIMAKVIGISKADRANQTIYDPTCGSGSLLLKAADEAQTKISIYGQEKDVATTALAKMNMILHDFPSAEIAPGGSSTLVSPHFLQSNSNLKLFDYVVANPPFSTKAWSSGINPADDPYRRFEDGIPPKKNGDYAFLLHVLRSMKSTGKGAVILPHGVLYRGNAEGEIRKNIIRKGYIKGIIGLPANLFYGTSIPACIIVLDKENAAARKGIFMVNASQGFVKDGNKNRLRHQDIHKIVDVFTKQLEIQKYSRIVPLAEIEAHDYNLNIPRYIDNIEQEDLQDISAHLLGGIPNRDIDSLSPYWDVFPALRTQLFADGNRPGYSQIKVDAAQIKKTIFAHPEFETFNKTMVDLFEKWKNKNKPALTVLEVGSHPKVLIESLAEDLLATFGQARLISNYDVYQHLMTYWAEAMQDDVYMIATEGWAANPDLIPDSLIVNRYFAAEQKEIEKMIAEQEASTVQMDELAEEQSGEGGFFEEVKNDKGKITKGNLKARLKDIEDDDESQEEFKVLNDYLLLIEKESEAGRQVKEVQKILNEKVVAKYRKLVKEEVKTLVVEDKWLAALAADVQTELDRVSQTLTGRIKELAERYAVHLPEQMKTVNDLTDQVNAHLKKMGFIWN